MSTVTLQDGVIYADVLLGDYLDHVASLGLSGRALRDRTRIAHEFLSRNPDLAAWMALPAIERAAELRSSGAWPLVCYAIGTDRIRLDVELAAVKQLTGLARAVEARDTAGWCRWDQRARCSLLRLRASVFRQSPCVASVVLGQETR